jgi:hypothetical protein
MKRLFGLSRSVRYLISHRSSVITGAVIAGCCMGYGFAAEIPARVNPLADALGILKVNDPRLLDRETTQFAAGLGIDPAPMRDGLARLLFQSRNLAGIDLSRPALLAWRKKAPHLVAIIPLADRRSFLDNFGASFGNEAPLIRISEREGTVVYTQNTNEGLLEYRLIVSERAAYLGRNIADCRALSEVQLPPVTNEAPLYFRASAEYIQQFKSDLSSTQNAPEYTKALQVFGESIQRFRQHLQQAWNGLLDQINYCEVSIRPDNDGKLHVVMTVTAVPESQLSVWISNQRNQPSRLLPIVARTDSVITAAGNIAWQGQAEQLGQLFQPIAAAQAGNRWNEQVEENWTAMWRLADRAGAFAWAADVEAVAGQAKIEMRSLVEQPRAQDMLSLLTLVSQASDPRIGEVVAAGSATGYRYHLPEGDQVMVANERYLFSILSNKRDPVLVAQEITDKSLQLDAPVGQPGIIALTMNATPYVQMLVSLMGGTSQPGLPVTNIMLTAKTALPGQLVIEGIFPASQFAQLLRDSGIMQITK